ncbi:transposase [Chengkuizengella marina]|uniref:Transposase zinc-ribbon domain-containing protein n=1 Tax=Chengkuizengella marina TaxID=2507566 RepID=A0A6N9PZE9_9BACL|nr:hypothetical protein [Chengkuizengella marina]
MYVLNWFQKEFGTEEACAEYLMYKRWNDGYRCTKCNHNQYLLHKNS